MNLYVLNFVMGLFGSWLVAKSGYRMGLYDIPNHRSSHVKAIPKGAGIGILCAFVSSSLLLFIPFYFWLPSFFVSLISLWGGDKHLLSPEKRLILQFACSLCFLFFFLSTTYTGVFIYLLCIPLSVFIVGTSNFYNFMDGIDGIAGITGLVGFSLLAFYSYMNGVDESYSKLCIALACSCVGFLCFNIPKAKVFLGDIGSILLGFVFACLTIVLSDSISDFLVMVGFLSTFYFDEFFTMVIRIRCGDSLISSHRKHIYQLLVNELFINHWKIALIYGVIQLIIGISAIWLNSELCYLLLLYGLYGLILTISAFRIHKMVAAK
jgi:Fuc2NAc and GlcNAc transferase